MTLIYTAQDIQLCPLHIDLQDIDPVQTVFIEDVRQASQPALVDLSVETAFENLFNMVSQQAGFAITFVGSVTKIGCDDGFFGPASA